MISALVKAAEQLFSRPFRAVLLKSVGLTLGLFVAVWVLIQVLVAALSDLPYPWLDTAIGLVTALGLLVGLVFLIGPVTALFAGLFLDDIAAEVEREHYPRHDPGTPLPAGTALLIALRFTVVVVLVNLGVLVLIWLPGINVMAYLVGNGYLLGREYFEMVGMRHLPPARVRSLRKQHSGRVFLCGIVLAFLAAIPFVNLLLPLFATAFMVHVFKSAQRVAGS